VILKWRNSIEKPFNKLLQSGLDLLFPPQCAGCGKHGAVLCPACQEHLQNTDQVLTLNLTGMNCEPEPERFVSGSLQVWSDVWYQPPASSMLIKLKYRPDRQLANVMAVRLAQLYRKEGLQLDILAGVPLAAMRQRRRGYNQIELVCRPLAEKLKLHYHPEVISRIRETSSQVGLTEKERHENVRQAFIANAHLVRGKRVLLVDDVLTTGATLTACSCALYQAGAAEVSGMSIARARSKPQFHS